MLPWISSPCLHALPAARRDKQAAEEKALTAEAALQQERLRTADDLAQVLTTFLFVSLCLPRGILTASAAQPEPAFSLTSSWHTDVTHPHVSSLTLPRSVAQAAC